MNGLGFSEFDRGERFQTQIALSGEKFSFSEEGNYKTQAGNILALHGFTVTVVEKSFAIDGKIFHKVKIQRNGANMPLGEYDYQLQDTKTYIIDSHGNFITVDGKYAPQKICDIVGKIPIFGKEYYLGTTHTGLTYLLTPDLKIAKDSLKRDIRNIFKTVQSDGLQLIFCEVWEYGAGLTNTVLKANFSPIRTIDGKEIIKVLKYDFQDDTIVLTVETEDGKIENVQIRK